MTADSLFRLPSGVLSKDEQEVFFADLVKQRPKREHKLLQRLWKEEEDACCENGS